MDRSLSGTRPVGLLAQPQVISSSANWSYVQTEQNCERCEARPKPGYRSSTRGAALVLSTQASGEHFLRVGHLGTRASDAAASLTCVAGCSCAELLILANASKGRFDRTTTTEFSPWHLVRAPAERACHVALTLRTQAQPFKLVALHVRSA